MGSCLGMLRWTPEVFRRATFYEYTAAMKGYLVAKGVDLTEPMTRDEYLELKAKDEAQRKFSD